MNFIRNDEKAMYEIKSLEYSIIYFLDIDTLRSILKGSDMDYELYCLLRDKCSNIPDEYELFKCSICRNHHTKFTCPKIHYIPIKQHVTNKYIHRFKTAKQFSDYEFIRYNAGKQRTMKIYKELN